MKKRINFKRLLNKRNKGGFTLVEVIISCALLSILVLGVMSFVGPALNMINSTQKNARATMLAETINSYISGTLKYAKDVAVYDNITHDHTVMVSSLKLSSAADEGLNKLNTFMKTGTNAVDYEVRCIGIRWLDETKTGKKKLVLTNETVDNNFTLADSITMRLTADASDGSNIVKVFDDTLYDGLYPIISLETFADEGSSNNAKGYKISTKVYGDIKCYSSQSEAARKKSYLAFEGASYVRCLNMSEPAAEPLHVTSLQNQIDWNRGSLGYTEGSNLYYYPDTYIYYVVLKK